MCLATLKHGWPYCRPVIMVDGSALKARFGGMLLAACDHDANGSIFLLAFANLLYPDAAFGICVKHLAANLKTRWFVERREEALKITSKLVPKAEKLIRTNFSLGLTPRPADQFEYAVTNNVAQIWIVDMSGKTCTCRQFQVDQIPYPHAMAVCNHHRIDVYIYCSNYYTKDYLYACYAHVVHPIGSAEGWDVPEEVRSQIVNPPNTKRGPGRPRVHRILSQ
ncbi:hypothetical protein TIFTF001_052831, partial [Ficus carica]